MEQKVKELAVKLNELNQQLIMDINSLEDLNTFSHQSRAQPSPGCSDCAELTKQKGGAELRILTSLRARTYGQTNLQTHTHKLDGSKRVPI